MPQYWVLHNAIHETQINSHYENKLLIDPYCGIPENVPIEQDDYVFLMRGKEYLYGYGRVEHMEEPRADGSGKVYKCAKVRPLLLRSNLARMDQIESIEAFSRSPLEMLGGAISPLDSEQARALWGFLPGDRRPPEPPREIPDGWAQEGERHYIAGGQGTITKVRNVRDGTLGALKRLHPDSQKNSERRSRFSREVSSLQLLEGNGTPLVLASNVAQWQDKKVEPYAIMEWIDGPNLREHIQKQRMSLDKALGTTLALLDIVERCHGLEIQHRDIKPENVILRSSDYKAPVLIDFGIAFRPPSEDEPEDFKTAAGQELGNRFLRLPEHAPNSHISTPISDLTHLVGLLFFMVTGRNPVQLRDANGRPPHEAQAQHIPREIVEDTRWSFLQMIFAIGFQYRTDQRFQSAGDLRKELEFAQTGAGDEDERLTQALKTIEAFLASEDHKIIEQAPNRMRQLSEELVTAASKAAKDAGFIIHHHFDIGRLPSGMPIANQGIAISRVGGPEIRLGGTHSIHLENRQYVAVLQTDRGSRYEYFRGPADQPELLAQAVLRENNVKRLLVTLVEDYGKVLIENTPRL